MFRYCGLLCFVCSVKYQRPQFPHKHTDLPLPGNVFTGANFKTTIVTAVSDKIQTAEKVKEKLEAFISTVRSGGSVGATDDALKKLYV